MLKNRVYKFFAEIEMPVKTFCRRVNIAPSTYYRWRNDDIRLSEETEERISKFLEKYNI